MRTADLQEAKARLDEWFIKHHRPQNASLENMTIAQALTSYWEDHGKNIASAASVKSTCRHWLEYWQDKSVAELVGLRPQEKFHQWLRERGLSDASINRTIMVGKAALNRSWANGEIIGVPKFISLSVTNAPPRGRPLEIQEVQALLDNVSGDHVRNFILLMLGTASRPDAIFDLQRSQCDLERGIIQLNAPGRQQTKKYRPIVKLPKQLEPIIGNMHTGYLITYRGRPVKSLKVSWRKLRDRAGLDGSVQPYSLRHTMARHMRASSVPAWEVASQLGHRKSGMSITETYASADPNYLLQAVAAIEDYLSDLSY